MRPEQRVVATIPVRELWDAGGTLGVTRGPLLSAAALGELLRRGPVRFAVADCGLRPRWIEPADAFAFWKDEVAPRLIDPAVANSGIRLDAFPGGYGYLASEWSGDGQAAIVLLETYH